MGVYFTLVLHCMARGEGGVTYESVLSYKSSEKHQTYILYHHKFFGDYKHFLRTPSSSHGSTFYCFILHSKTVSTLYAKNCFHFKIGM